VWLDERYRIQGPDAQADVDSDDRVPSGGG